MKYVFKNRTYIFLISVIDFAGRIFSFFIPKKKNIENINNILLVRLDHLGDVIHSLHIPQILKKYLPNVKITFLVSGSLSEIAASNPFVDNVISYDAPWFSRTAERKSTLGAILELRKKISAAEFDVGFELRGDFRQILIMWLAGVKFKIGYGVTGGCFLLELCPEYKNNLTEKEKNINLVEEFLKRNLKKDINLIAEDKPYYEYLPSTEQEELTRKFHLEYNKRYILMHPFAGVSSRMWSNEKWVNLIDSLSDKYGDCGIIIVGKDNDYSFRFEGKKAINLINKTTLKELTGLCRMASLMISCNSGPAHIAYVLNRPLVVIASGTNTIDNWFENNKNTSIIQKKTACYDCQTKICPKEKQECMENISVREVMKEVAGLLSDNKFPEKL